MGTENETAGGTNGTAAVVEAKTRKRRPWWLLVPVKGEKTYEVYCFHGGAKAARKLLQDLGIDPTDPRLGGLKLVRGEEIALTTSAQVVFKFGKSAEDDADADDE